MGAFFTTHVMQVNDVKAYHSIMASNAVPTFVDIPTLSIKRPWEGPADDPSIINKKQMLSLSDDVNPSGSDFKPSRDDLSKQLPIRPIQKIWESLRKETHAKEANTCMICDQHVTSFRDALSKKEYSISGMCQRCQDGIFKDFACSDSDSCSGSDGEDDVAVSIKRAQPADQLFTSGTQISVSAINKPQEPSKSTEHVNDHDA